jgi:hypothetical protein
LVELGFVVATINHFDPFQRSTSVRGGPNWKRPGVDCDEPTAVQLVALAHETSASELKPRGRLGLGTIDHVLPFQRSINVAGSSGPPMSLKPTAKQLVALVHATLLSMLPEPIAGLGLVTIDHFVPFQRSINVLEALPVAAPPTAKQLVGLVQDTPLSSGSGAPLGVGLATNDQTVPSQCSISVGPPVVPTAKQSDGMEHETPDSSPAGGPAGLTLGTIDHGDDAPADPPAMVTTPITSVATTNDLANFKAIARRMVPPHAP